MLLHGVCLARGEGMKMRDEIAALQCPPEASATTYVKLLANVLAIVDRHEASRGTFACPICAGDSPHAHSKEDVDEWINAQAGRFGYSAHLRDPGETDDGIPRDEFTFANYMCEAMDKWEAVNGSRRHDEARDAAASILDGIPERTSPSKERPAPTPAKDELRTVLACLERGPDATATPTLGNALLIGVEAIIEAVEANTAAVREMRS
jgi:hypothetical protein